MSQSKILLEKIKDPSNNLLTKDEILDFINTNNSFYNSEYVCNYYISRNLVMEKDVMISIIRNDDFIFLCNSYLFKREDEKIDDEIVKEVITHCDNVIFYYYNVFHDESFNLEHLKLGEHLDTHSHLYLYNILDIYDYCKVRNLDIPVEHLDIQCMHLINQDELDENDERVVDILNMIFRKNCLLCIEIDDLEDIIKGEISLSEHIIVPDSHIKYIVEDDLNMETIFKILGYDNSRRLVCEFVNSQEITEKFLEYFNVK